MDREKFSEVEEAAEEKAKLARFIEWLERNGSNFSECVEMRAYDDEVRGVHAKRQIEEDEVVIEVPLKCLITVEMGKATPVGQAVLVADLELDAPKHVFLMLFMLIDRKNPHSFFRPYYDILPKRLHNMPIFWSPDELAWLEGSYLLRQIEERKAAIANDYAAICDVWPSFGETATLEEFSWARMAVCSRNFGVVVDGLRTSAMVPHADMLNHLRPRETKWTYDNSRGAFTITSIKTIYPGAQVYDSYGQKCNHRFLLNYGFAVENNCESDGFCPNEVPIALSVQPDDPLATPKASFWARDGLGDLKRVRVCASDNENARLLFSLLRVLVADAADLAAISQGPTTHRQTAKDIGAPLSLRNERAMLRALRALCTDYLRAYPTTYEEDVQALARTTRRAATGGQAQQGGSGAEEGEQEQEQDDDGVGWLEPFSNERHARIQVCGEKAVLYHYLVLTDTALDVLELDGANVAPRAQSLFAQKHSHVAKYCADLVPVLLSGDPHRS